MLKQAEWTGSETQAIYWALFRGTIPPLLAQRYEQATRKMDRTANARELAALGKLVAYGADLEAAELAARLTGRLPLLDAQIPGHGLSGRNPARPPTLFRQPPLQPARRVDPAGMAEHDDRDQAGARAVAITERTPWLSTSSSGRARRSRRGARAGSPRHQAATAGCRPHQ